MVGVIEIGASGLGVGVRIGEGVGMGTYVNIFFVGTLGVGVEAGCDKKAMTMGLMGGSTGI